jgi:UDP-N-acetylmuramoylalanine--D-glutamate ligase
MMNTDYFKNKKITVVGLAHSGYASASLLADLGVRVSVTDKSSNATTQDYAQKLKTKGVETELGAHTPGFIKERDLIIISPGVDNKALPVVWAEELRIPIISEIELGWLLCPATVIAVTGTNGKTTVTTLIGMILERAGRNVFVCGNIGNPFTAAVSAMNSSDFVSLEVSSFQLERIDKFKPKISVLLNFSCNHLDRHQDMQEYLQAKKRIFKNQDKNDYLVLNYHDSTLKALAQETQAQIVYFQGSGDLNPNYAAAWEVARILGIDKKLALAALADFKGVEHRLEYAGKLNGIDFINDSKATTVDSTLWALNNIDSSIILIAGGRDKGLDFSILRDKIGKKVKSLVLIGEARGKIRQALEGVLPISEEDSLEKALEVAWSQAQAGDSILLSPMCASFDMFANFEERGNRFKQAVQDLISKFKAQNAKLPLKN